MNEAQERNLVRFVVGNSIPLDDMFGEYLAFCQEHGYPDVTKDYFALNILRKPFRIIVIEGQAYVFGAIHKGEFRHKASVYVKDTPPVEKAEWDQWIAEHTWKPEA